MPERVGEYPIMARNTGPATAAPRWPDPREGQAAARPDQQQQHFQPQNPQGYQQVPGQPYPYRDAAQGQGYEPYPPQPHQQPGPYGNQADPYGDQASYPPPSQGYVPPQTTHYAPQFEPYQPPQAAAPTREVNQGWESAPQQWQNAEPTPAYQQPAPRAPAQPASPPPYDPASHVHQPAGYAHQVPQAAPALRGATYDQAPSYDQGQPYDQTPPYDPAQQAGWPAQPPMAEDPYGHQEPAWGAPQGQGYDNQAYQGYEQEDYDPRAYGQQAYGDPGYASRQPYGYGDAAGAYPDPAADPNAFPPEPGFGAAEPVYAPPVQQDPDGYADEDYESDELAYDDDQLSGLSRWMKVAAMAAAGLLVIGGGVYGYTKFTGTSRSGDPPVVHKADAPSKIKPDDPGGKKFAHTDSKILGRLSDGGDTPASDSSGDTDSGGTRKVSTMVIGRDGSIVATSDIDRPPPARLPESVSPVPGMTIVDGFGGRRPQVSAQPSPSAPSMINSPRTGSSEPPPPAAAPKQTEPAPSAKPVVIARTEPAPTPTASAPKATTTKRVTRAAPVSQPSASSGAGYVAVLASIPRSGSSRMDALKQFADLQQRYASQLGGKTPDVQEANLGDRGTYHRLIVGPPSSRQEASRLCANLKSAGYSSCWIKSY